MSKEFIKIGGAREHNLKNLTLEIPRDKLVVITGLSGSRQSAGLSPSSDGWLQVRQRFHVALDLLLLFVTRPAQVVIGLQTRPHFRRRAEEAG